jgi:NADH-ubiquinone oxidoreductase chain 6
MTNLFVLNETFTNGLNYSVINFISFTSILCGIFVIISKNPIVSVLFLIGLFLNIASYLMMLGMNFIGLSYLLVYVGAVSILFLFILMLINIRISELTSDSSNSIPLAVIIGIFFNITLYRLLPSNMLSPNIFFLDKKFAGIMPEEFLWFDFFTSTTYSVRSYMKVFLNSDLSFVSSQIWDGSLAETSHITSIGNIIYTSYPLWLILTSLILLLAMVGAIVITIKK